MSNCDNIQCVYKHNKSMFSWFKNNKIQCNKGFKKVYCCEKCQAQDWFSGHQFACEGVKTKFSQEEATEIEETTSFLKPGKFLTDEDLANSVPLSLDMFEYIDGEK